MSLLINHFYRFKEFILDTDQKILLRDGKPLSLTPKVFETLLILLENNGRIVGKEELMKRLWPDTFVEEANLTFNIQQLRKILGDKARNPIYIETISRRGYRFIADVEKNLIDAGTINGHLIQEVDIPLAHPPDTVELQGVQPSTISKAGQLAIADVGSIRINKRSFAFAAALLIILSGVGVFLWKFSNALNKNSSESSKVDGKSPVIPLLKFEKLTGAGQSRQVAISPDGKYIAYTRTQENKIGIWLRQLATNTNVEIVPAMDAIFGLAFINSGDSIYFVSGKPTALYRVSLLGGVATKIIDKLEGNFAISSDDRQIAFIRQIINREGQKEFSLIIADLDGRNERILFTGTYPNALDVPLWSPDDQSVICSYGHSESGGQDVSLIEISVADGTKKDLSTDRFFCIGKMAWLPHKNGLVMSAGKQDGDNNQLWRVSYPGMEISRITEELASYLDLSFASKADKAVASQATRISDIWVGLGREPNNLKKITQAIDGFCWQSSERLIYSSTASGNRDLWIMQPDGSEQRQLTVDPAIDSTPSVTSDNRYIIFLSNRTGTFQVWRMNIDGSNQTRLTDGTGKNYPVISPDGKWVVYNSADDWHIWKVSIDGGEPVALTNYIGYRPGISPDGKMIACAGRNESKQELLILPFAGGQPVKRFDIASWEYNLQWTPDSKALVFVVKSGTRAFFMKQSLETGTTEKIAELEEEGLNDFAYSSGNRFFAITRSVWQHDLVLISDINGL
jgi:Tol biopolymer transport system component/DNA-binding winged helix-turn-helix (wHTH) protein